MIELADDLETSADGALVVDDSLRVVFANRSAQRILGFRLNESPYRYCHQLMRGRDDQRRLVCHVHCLVAKEVLSGTGVSNFDLQIASETGDIRWLNMSAFRHTDKGNGASYIVHLFRDITQQKRDAEFVERLVEAARHYRTAEPEPILTQRPARAHAELTPREREVLTLLAEGHATRDIAERLSISVNTARNHIQRILQKLEVHTRLEAVIYAKNSNLVD